jgi:pimeloyl-ACP methyl ester carboxylesterase
MDVLLGGLRGQLERPQTRKFTWPIIILPELFSGSRHLAIMAGHLVSLGWEVYLLDVHPQSISSLVKDDSRPNGFRTLVDNIRTALQEIGSDIVAAGHGLGGLLALKLAEAPPVKAAVALAPLTPGVRSPLFVRRLRWLFWWRETTGLPNGRVMLDLVSEAEPFQRQALIKALIPADISVAMEVARGAVEFAPHPTPRLIVVGDADAFAPWHQAEQFASNIGAQFVTLPGRGHWIIAGRALERAISHVQRFLVRALGEELLLLYQEPTIGEEKG